ncbi:MAG: histidine triad nucleotide-binding protein [Candidatus Gracilibacteria bacterium]|nr:histidine triad nucleotide-binding protein [Candidatus Gracilibacteria bacterium]MDD2908282.1 histidine triad nucleotide-binding protein [Candidatus Gracilibacteria bacterium]
MDCIFCKIINKEIPVETVFEDDNYIVINDIHPKAKVHMLLIPKKHIETINDLENNDRNLVGGLLLLARDLSKKLNIQGYKLQFNVGEAGGQEVMHIHLHFLAN